MSDAYHTLFGDIHNHNALGYGVGSLERSIDVARTHLDFFAFTGHSSWHDMVPMEGGRERHWLRGFDRLREGWPSVQRLIADANRDGEFAAFLGFEWHSSRFGDQCVVFPEDHRPLVYPQDVEALRAFCVDERALMIPHHLAYPSGRRGVNWEIFDEACTPVVEIYSEHGNSEDDRGPFGFFSHSMGGREMGNTATAALARGLRFGFVASSDNHAGFPGAYGEGVLGVLARDLDRAAILEAVRARRTYALTGDRIEVDLTVDGAPMGASIRGGDSVEVAFDLRGRDEMEVVEIVSGGAVVHRAYPQARYPEPEPFAAPVQLRLEWGWGPWQALALGRICDWRMRLAIEGGRLVRWFPCLQSGPFDEERRHRFEPEGDGALAISSYTSREGAYRENPNQSVVIEVVGDSDTTLDLLLERPERCATRHRLGDLVADSANLFTGPFPKEGYQWHRLVPLAASRVTGRCEVPVGADPAHVYLRARQRNGHLAWASPVFVNHR